MNSVGNKGFEALHIVGPNNIANPSLKSEAALGADDATAQMSCCPKFEEAGFGPGHS